MKCASRWFYYTDVLWCTVSKILNTYIIFSCGVAAQRGLWPHSRGFLDHTHDALQSVGLLWTSDQSVAETSTWEHTTLTTDIHPCPRRGSKPESQQASGADLALDRAATGTGSVIPTFTVQFCEIQYNRSANNTAGHLWVSQRNRHREGRTLVVSVN
jgi:hypothetical protein